MRIGPYEGFAVDIFFEESFFEHGTEGKARGSVGDVGIFVDDVEEAIESAWIFWFSVTDPLFSWFSAFPHVGGES